ncbi:MAG: translational GTPase TypA [Clostridiales bacterium]|nr:translational GTPase TypA [Candidatus Blautia equi]
MNMKREDVRNVAIIAHVDHGKTTLVDQLLRQSGVFRDNQEVQERVMDSNDIERERGITILSKNTAVHYNGVKINIIDTPGHADFGGEVERVLKMVDGVILLVDAFEGAMPQTKFVLRKALELNLHVIVCINKIDRPEARPDEVIDEVLELLMDLDASDEQLDCPFLFASAKAGHAVLSLDDEPVNMAPLFDTILKYIPAPEGDPEADTQVLISTIDYNEYIGRIGVGKVENGTIAVNQEVTLLNHHDASKRMRVKIGKLYEFDGLNRIEVKEASVGSIVAISGITEIHIGDTLCGGENPTAIPFQKISEPTIAMNFLVNDSPLAGLEGKYVTSRHLRDRLYRELNTDVSLRVEDTDTTECFKVSGRGELHLSVLIENMRREGFEFSVSKPEVLYKQDEKGKRLEPMELTYIDVPEEFSGSIISKLSERKGELQGMSTASDGSVRLEFSIPSRGLIGFRGDFLTSTKGTGVMNSIFDGYAPFKGEFQYRKQGSLIAFEAGESVTYGLFSAQERGTLFIGPGEKVYSGMGIGQNGKAEDIELNVCKTKHLTNTRSSSADEALKLTPPRILSLEQAIEFIDTDELLEVTPSSLRIRKRILDPRDRKRAAFKKAQQG